MHRHSLFSIAAAFPSSLLLIYLIAHVTEGWQLMVIAAFTAGFLFSWRRHSRSGLITSYAAATSLSAWVFWVNL